jgi:hypothetical protein
VTSANNYGAGYAVAALSGQFMVIFRFYLTVVFRAKVTFLSIKGFTNKHKRDKLLIWSKKAMKIKNLVYRQPSDTNRNKPSSGALR